MHRKRYVKPIPNVALPPPRMGRARGGGEAPIILREDQDAWQIAVKKEAARVRKEERRVEKAAIEKEKRGADVWMDPDWVPSLIVGGTHGHGLPKIGWKPPSNRGRRRK